MSQGTDENPKNESTSPAASEPQAQDVSAQEKSAETTPEYEPHPDEEAIR